MPSARLLAQHERLLQPVAGNAELVRYGQLRPAHVCTQLFERPLALGLARPEHQGNRLEETHGGHSPDSPNPEHADGTRLAAISAAVKITRKPASRNAFACRHSPADLEHACPLNIMHGFLPSAQVGKEFAQLLSRIVQPVNNVRLKTSIGFHANPSAPIRQTVTNDEGFLEALVSSPFGPKAAARSLIGTLTPPSSTATSAMSDELKPADGPLEHVN